MPTFEFLKKEKLKKGNKDYDDIMFRAWRGNFSANLEKNTSVLNVKYEDKDIDLIIPVLKKISKSYQKYSNKNRLRNIELANRFFEEQIIFYKDKSKKSTKKATEYGFRHSLTPSGDYTNKILSGGTNFSIIPVDVEIKRKKQLIKL